MFLHLLLLVGIWNIINKQDPDLLLKPHLSASLHLAQPYLPNMSEIVLGATS